MKLQEALRLSFEDKENIIISNSILGTIDEHQIAEGMDNFCIHHFGSAISSSLYIGFSVGASFGLELENGMQIFIKVNKPTSADTITAISHESLTAVSSVQKSLAEIGFPCPRVLAGPMELGAGLATVDVFSAPGEQKDAHDPAIRGSIARKFLQSIRSDETLNTVKANTVVKKGAYVWSARGTNGVINPIMNIAQARRIKNEATLLSVLTL